MFTLNTLSRVCVRPVQCNTAQRCISGTHRLPTQCDGGGENSKQPGGRGSGGRPKKFDEDDLDHMKQNFSPNDCKFAFSECSKKIEDLEKQVMVFMQAQKVMQAKAEADKCVKTRNKCCPVKPPKKEKQKNKKIPYIIGLILAAAGIIYYWNANKDKKDEKEKTKEENKENPDDDKKET